MVKPVDLENSTEYKGKIKSNNKKKIIMISLAILVIIAVMAYFINIFVNTTYNAYEILTKTPRPDSSTVKYMKYGKNLLRYSRDGASAIDGRGKELWNGTYNMKEPVADISGEYVAIADIGRERVVVFDGKGNTATVDAQLPIQKIRVAQQGVVFLLLQDRGGNKISICEPFNPSKKVIYDIATNVEQHGYPVDMDISEDGKKLVTSYLHINNQVIENTLNFYNFGEIGQNADQNLMGFFPYKDIIVPKVEFVTNNIICAYGENQFTLYSMKERPSVIRTEKFDTNIKSIFSNENYIGFILENLNGKEKYRLKIYDLNGKNILDKTIDYDYEKVLISGREIIFYTNLECTILKLNGKEKFKFKFDKNISFIIPINDYNKYFVIDYINIEEIKLVEAKKLK